MAAAGDDDDVYATSDAAWLTESAEVDGETDTDDADDDTGVQDAADDDMGDGDAHDASAEEAMTDDTTVADATGVETPVADTTVADTTVAGTATERATASAQASAATTTARRPGKPRGGKGRATRPTQTAGTTGTVPPGEPAQDAPDATDAAAAAPATQGAAAPATAKTAKKRPATTKRPATAPKQPQQPVVLRASGLVKRYGQTLAADEVDLEIRQGSIFGVVGPNGAGKTTTLSMVTGLLRPDAGSVTVLDHDVWTDPTAAKRDLGVLPDRLRLFDRLTGAQLLYYSATLRGLDGATARQRSADLAEAFGLGEALGRQVADYSVGMAKKIALAATLIHSPRVLVLDEPFESVDPVSAATITEILRRYTRGGGTVVLSSHSMELVQRTCDSVAIIVGGKVLASGTMAQVRGRKSLEDKFVELAGGRVVAESMEWLHSFSD
ncbi:ABC transporter ATP-binding protein [Curtobacterium sp. 22159]|uniref:ABC transporter ATP-binding protein n=1 Tax=Curtobacterium sp. 22159 TaxID=3453882 RepID=UPI003F83145C